MTKKKDKKEKNVKLNLLVPEQLEKDFRQAVFNRYGMKRGNISKAIIEAVKDWINKQ